MTGYLIYMNKQKKNLSADNLSANIQWYMGCRQDETHIMNINSFGDEGIHVVKKFTCSMYVKIFQEFIRKNLLKWI